MKSYEHRFYRPFHRECVKCDGGSNNSKMTQQSLTTLWSEPTESPWSLTEGPLNYKTGLSKNPRVPSFHRSVRQLARTVRWRLYIKSAKALSHQNIFQNILQDNRESVIFDGEPINPNWVKPEQCNLEVQPDGASTTYSGGFVKITEGV